MILILTDESEYTSDCVIEWLISFNAKFMRISRLDIIHINNIIIQNNKIDFEVIINNNKLLYSEISNCLFFF